LLVDVYRPTICHCLAIAASAKSHFKISDFPLVSRVLSIPDLGSLLFDLGIFLLNAPDPTLTRKARGMVNESRFDGGEK
jgi:hypothetical protein